MARLALLGAALLCALAVSTQGHPGSDETTGRKLLEDHTLRPHVYDYRELGYNWADPESPFSGGNQFAKRSGDTKFGVCDGPTGRQSPINIMKSSLLTGDASPQAPGSGGRTDAGRVNLNNMGSFGSPYEITDISVNLEQDMQLFFNEIPAQGNPTLEVRVDGSVETWELKPAQLHFHHFLSEHTFDGQHFPLEAHMVLTHNDKPAGVIAVMYEYSETEEDPFLQTVFNAVDTAMQNGATVGQTKQPITTLELNVRRDLLPASTQSTLDYFGYDGSLTTPPCTEGAKWHIFEATRTVTRGQMEKFVRYTLDANPAAAVTNNRVIQGSNALIDSDTAECGGSDRHCRKVYEYSVQVDSQSS